MFVYGKIHCRYTLVPGPEGVAQVLTNGDKSVQKQPGAHCFLSFLSERPSLHFGFFLLLFGRLHSCVSLWNGFPLVWRAAYGNQGHPGNMVSSICKAIQTFSRSFNWPITLVCIHGHNMLLKCVCTGPVRRPCMSDDLSLIPRAHWVEGRNWSLQVFLWPPHVRHGMCPLSPAPGTNERNKLKNVLIQKCSDYMDLWGSECLSRLILHCTGDIQNLLC